MTRGPHHLDCHLSGLWFQAVLPWKLLEASRGFFSRVLKPDWRLNQQFFPSHWDLGGAAVRFSRPRSTITLFACHTCAC